MSYWILQSDPADFRLADWLRDFNWVAVDRLVDRWYIDSFAGEVQPGNTVFIWVNDGRDTTAGICAQGRIVATPDVFPLADREKEYCSDQEVMKRLAGLSRIAVKYNYLRLGSPLLTEEVEKRADLRLIPIASDSRSRIQPVSNASGLVIERMLNENTGMIELQNCRT